MIDTVKLIFYEGSYRTDDRFTYRHPTGKDGTWRLHRNPTAQEKAAGLIIPKVSITKTPVKGGHQERMIIEFSAPKLLFGNNFDELAESDFDRLCLTLADKLNNIGVHINIEDIRDAKVAGWHPSKNIIFDDPFACKELINLLHKVAVTKVFTVMKTDFVDGEILRVHSNYKELVAYDKLTDLRRGIVSDKRALENDNRQQAHIVRAAKPRKDISVFRLEARFNGVKAVKQAYGSAMPFHEMFSVRSSQDVLTKEWLQFTNQIDYLGLKDSNIIQLLQNKVRDGTTQTPKTLLASVAATAIASQSGYQALRQVIDATFGSHVWGRLKPLITLSVEHEQYALVSGVSTALEDFQPVNLKMLYDDNFEKLVSNGKLGATL